MYRALVRWSPSTTASVRLPVSLSVGMSRRLLMTSSAQASRPIAAAAAQRQPGQRPHLHVGRAGDRGQAEEHEYRHLAQRPVAVRAAAPGVEPGRRDRGSAQQQQPPGSDRGQHQAGRAGDGEAAKRGRQHMLRLRQAGADQPDRADADLIGAADAVAVVVGVVDARSAARAPRAGPARPARARTCRSRRPRPSRRRPGTTAAGRVRGRAPATQVRRSATSGQSLPCRGTSQGSPLRRADRRSGPAAAVRAARAARRRRCRPPLPS